MDALTYAQARQNLAKTMDTVCDGHTPVVITRPKAEAVVLMSLADYNGLMETAYLQASPKNAARLRESLAQARQGHPLPPPSLRGTQVTKQSSADIASSSRT